MTGWFTIDLRVLDWCSCFLDLVVLGLGLLGDYDFYFTSLIGFPSRCCSRFCLGGCWALRLWGVVMTLVFALGFWVL